MATFDDRWLVEALIAGGGRLPWDREDAPDNPPAVRIVEYTNAAGRATWGVVFRGDRDPDRYERETPFVRRARVVWAATEPFETA